MITRLVLTAIFAAAVVALAGCGGSNDSESAQATAPSTTAPAVTAPETSDTTETVPASKPKSTTITVRVVGGKPQGGIKRPKVAKNEKVVLVVRSDVADEVHLHGYDVSRPVAAGGTARLAFVATIPGRFEVELENSGVQIAELTVQ